MKPHTFDANETETRDSTPTLEDRMEAAEHRLERSLLCLDRCQKELAELRRGLRALAQEQNACRTGQARRFRLVGYGFLALLALLFAAEASTLASLVWRLLSALAALLGVEPEMAAGVILAALLPTLAALTVRWLLRRRASRRREEGCCPSTHTNKEVS